MREERWRAGGMGAIDGDRLKAFLDDTEKTLDGGESKMKAMRK